MRVNLVDTPRGQLLNWVSGRNITPDRGEIGMERPTVEVEEEGEVEGVDEEEEEEGVIDRSRVDKSIDNLHSINE
jgi:hypothetical protein